MTKQPNNKELITIADSLIKTKEKGAYKIGHVGCAVVTTGGAIYHGIALDLSSGLGLCAERTAIAQMLTNQEYDIDRIVAVWADKDGQSYVLPPCGACLQFMKLVVDNKDTMRIIMSEGAEATLSELLPKDWWKDKAAITT